MRTSATRLVAALIVGLEGAGLLALTVWQVVALLSGDVGSTESAVALIVLTLVGAAGVLAFGVSILRGRSWARSGGIVLQVLILAVALGAATGAYAHPVTGLIIAVPAVVALVLLALDARSAGHAASGPESGD